MSQDVSARPTIIETAGSCGLNLSLAEPRRRAEAHRPWVLSGSQEYQKERSLDAETRRAALRQAARKMAARPGSHAGAHRRGDARPAGPARAEGTDFVVAFDPRRRRATADRRRQGAWPRRGSQGGRANARGHREGRGPGGVRRARTARRRAAANGIGTLGSVIAAYYEQGPGASSRSGAASRALIERVFARHLTRPAVDVRAEELQLAIDGWRSKASAKRVAAGFRPMVRWASKRGLMTKGDPLENRRRPSVLTRGEVGALLGALEGRGAGAAARFMLLTGSRREEACGATWGEIKDGFGPFRARDGRTLGRTRSGRTMIMSSRCRSRRARSWRRSSRARRTRWCLRKRAETRLGNWTRWSAQMERRLGFEVTPHALRRTTATLAGDLGHPPHVVSALLGHRDIGGDLHDGYNQSPVPR